MHSRGTIHRDIKPENIAFLKQNDFKSLKSAIKSKFETKDLDRTCRPIRTDIAAKVPLRDESNPTQRDGDLRITS